MPAPRTSDRTIVGRRTRSVVSAAVADLERLRSDAGVTRSVLARAARVDIGYLSRVVTGDRQPSISVLVAIATALGADLSIRAFPTTGPNIYDRIQARIVEELVRVAHPSWRRAVEVAVQRPARGFVDLVLHRPSELVAAEVHTRLDRVEQTIRWSQDKARSLPSPDISPPGPNEPAVHRLLVLRSTATTREIARRFEATLAAAYPARASDTYAALTQPDRPWPGDAILWADVRGDDARILERPPRGVALGR